MGLGPTERTHVPYTGYTVASTPKGDFPAAVLLSSGVMRAALEPKAFLLRALARLAPPGGVVNPLVVKALLVVGGAVVGAVGTLWATRNDGEDAQAAADAARAASEAAQAAADGVANTAIAIEASQATFLAEVQAARTLTSTDLLSRACPELAAGSEPTPACMVALCWGASATGDTSEGSCESLTNHYLTGRVREDCKKAPNPAECRQDWREKR